MKTLKNALLATALLASTNCATGDDPEVEVRQLPISFVGPDGTLGLAGHYDGETETLTLSESVRAMASLGGDELVLDLGGAEDIDLTLDQSEVEVPVTLEVGDNLALLAGDQEIPLVVEAQGFQGDPAPAEVDRAPGVEAQAADCGFGGPLLRSASWHCAVIDYVDSPTVISWHIQDRLTDGYCVQLWAQFYNSGAWFRQGMSCGGLVTGTIPRGTGANRVRKLRMFRTSTSSSSLFSPPGRYHTVWEG